MAKQTQRLDALGMGLQEQDIKEAGKEAEGQRRTNVLGNVLGSPSNLFKQADKNILRLGGR